MSVRVTIEANWFTGSLTVESDDRLAERDMSLTDRVRAVTAQAEAAAVAALNAAPKERA